MPDRIRQRLAHRIIARLAEQIPFYRARLLVKPGGRQNSLDWSEGILRQRDERLRAAMGRNGRDYVRQNYRWDVILSKYDRMIANVRS